MQQMYEKKKLLLQILRQLQDNRRLLVQLRKHSHSCQLEQLLSSHLQKIIHLEWEGRQLAFQLGLEIPEPLSGIPLPCRYKDSRITARWITRNRETLARCRRALRQYPHSDSVSIFCRKIAAFSLSALTAVEKFPDT
jgi:hypothetical protein